MSKCLIVVYKY